MPEKIKDLDTQISTYLRLIAIVIILLTSGTALTACDANDALARCKSADTLISDFQFEGYEVGRVAQLTKNQEVPAGNANWIVKKGQRVTIVGFDLLNGRRQPKFSEKDGRITGCTNPVVRLWVKTEVQHDNGLIETLTFITDSRNLEPVYKQYLIKPGDTLWDIANEHGVSVDELAKINNIKNPNEIYAGQRIKIPVVNPTPTPESKIITPNTMHQLITQLNQALQGKSFDFITDQVTQQFNLTRGYELHKQRAQEDPTRLAFLGATSNPVQTPKPPVGSTVTEAMRKHPNYSPKPKV